MRYHILAAAWQTNARPDEEIQSAWPCVPGSGSYDGSRCYVNVNAGAGKRGEKLQHGGNVCESSEALVETHLSKLLINFGEFLDRALHFCLLLAWDCDPPTYACYGTWIISHCAQPWSELLCDINLICVVPCWSFLIGEAWGAGLHCIKTSLSIPCLVTRTCSFPLPLWLPLSSPMNRLSYRQLGATGLITRRWLYWDRNLIVLINDLSLCQIRGFMSYS
jgi:hypothetical protein